MDSKLVNFICAIAIVQFMVIGAFIYSTNRIVEVCLK